MKNTHLTLSRLSVIASAIAIILLNACSAPIESESEQSALATASGPFFSGPNSLIAEKEVNYDELIQAKTLQAEQIKSVKLRSVSVSLRAADSIDFSYFDNASLSIVSADLEMLAIATLNPIESSGQSLELGVSEEAELKDYFKAGKYSLVLDLGLNEDLYLDEIGADINLKLNLKYKD